MTLLVVLSQLRTSMLPLITFVVSLALKPRNVTALVTLLVLFNMAVVLMVVVPMLPLIRVGMFECRETNGFTLSEIMLRPMTPFIRLSVELIAFGALILTVSILLKCLFVVRRVIVMTLLTMVLPLRSVGTWVEFNIAFTVLISIVLTPALFMLILTPRPPTAPLDTSFFSPPTECPVRH